MATPLVVVVLVLSVAAGSGCASGRGVTLRAVPRSPLAETFQLTAREGPRVSDRALQLARVHDLAEYLRGDPRVLLAHLQEEIDREPTAEKVYAFAELSFLAAKHLERRNPEIALDLYGASVLKSYEYLFDERFAAGRNPYDPQFRLACDLYNGALESALRLVAGDGGLQPGETYTIETTAGRWDITCTLRGTGWRTEEFERFEFVSDYEVRGLKNHYQTYGLGVPLIAVRRNFPGEPRAAAYYPPELSFPVTAFLRPVPPRAGGDPARRAAVLELYDPLETTYLAIGDRRVPLESDLSTPLAFFLANPQMGHINTLGLLNPESFDALRPGRDEARITGLYMVQPYQPGKIPVIFVHGLWSSPMTWMEMFNDLRSSPEIREHYQFWFYLYPTGQPFWISATQMRRDLVEAREVLDPTGREPALDQMVLVGHSMGGLVSRWQTLHSRDDFWRVVSDRPFHEVRGDEAFRRELAELFFFEPNPSVRRVVTIGTPHRGSPFSNQATQWLSARLITLPKWLVQGKGTLLAENRDLIRDDRLLRIETSIESLSPRSPVFPVMLSAAERRPAWVTYHNIVGIVPGQGVFGRLAAGTDGVVEASSAQVDDVASELIVPADHMSVHSHPRAVLEIRRILLEHLDDLRGLPPSHPHDRTAARP